MTLPAVAEGARLLAQPQVCAGMSVPDITQIDQIGRAVRFCRAKLRRSRGAVRGARAARLGRAVAAVLVASSLQTLAGCGAWRATTVPLRVLSRPAVCAMPVDTLLVLLPGSYSLPEDFDREGFVAAVRARHFAVDLALVDAHVGYYRERSIIDRLAADVVAPARARGLRHVWIAGISIGGLGAMLYAQARPGDIDGIVALAPYLGSPEIARTVAAAGGLRRWRPADAVPEADDLDGTLWRWLRREAVEAPANRPFVLGFGRTDRFVENDRVLADALPPGRVFTADGGHDWPVWQVLWRDLLPTLPLPVDAGCRAP